MTAEEYLAIPYVMVLESVEKPDGDWVRQASYPELPGCVAQADTPLEAIDRLEEQRVRFIMERVQAGQPVPVPRPPLHRAESLSQERLEFARWLRQTDRISDHHKERKKRG
jgi:predicted RNase H-like HicB family nuclease